MQSVASFEEAQEVFNELSSHDVVSWTTLMTEYAECGYGKDTLKCLEKMQSAGVSPDAVTFVCGIKVCGNMGAPRKIQELHADIERKGLLSNNLFVASALIDMYAKCGFLIEAQQVFDKLQVHDVVLWNVLISGYIVKGQNKLALDVFRQMSLQDVVPDGVTYVHAIKACSNLGCIIKGQEIHVEVARIGLLERHVLVGSTLLDMYVKCDSLTKAQEVFDKLLVKDSITWNIMIAGYVEHGCDMKALDCFETMLFEGFCPDTNTYASVLRLFGSLQGAMGLGELLHAEIVKEGLLGGDLLIGNNLIEMYVKSSLLTRARQVFDGLPVRDVVSWNVLITGYAKHGYYEEALDCFAQICTYGVCPDVTTFVCCLNIFANLEALDKGQMLHSELGRLGLIIRDLSVASALVDMYAKCGLIAKAEEAFNSYPVRDVVMWNALIAGYAEHNHSEGALRKFEQMQLAGCSPSSVTIISILKACSKIGAVQRGQEIHAEVIAKGLFDGDLMVGNSLIELYAKTGALATAQQLFDQVPLNVKDISSWNVLIAGYAQLGKNDKVFLMVDKMFKEGQIPDAITFTILLTACSRACLFEKCLDYVEVMRKDFGIVPMFEHRIRILDGLGRVGELERVVGIIEKLPSCFSFIMWHWVLRACKAGGNVELGKEVFEQALSI